MQFVHAEPRKVFDYFKKISQIPHGSGNCGMLADYCLNFAQEHNLRAVKDSFGNVVIFKDGTKGYENSEPIILQGHLDMVCEKSPNCKIDMEKEAISLVTDGEFLSADGTTLGGDDGIAIAYMLALLASDDIPHPPIEALMTIDEEIGLRGARELQDGLLKGRRLINIDSEEEGILTVGCAGAVRAEGTLPLMFESTSDKLAVKISVGGLNGGHSGIDINLPRQNACKVLANFLGELQKDFSIRICDIQSGGRLNVIPQTANAIICINKANAEELSTSIAKMDAWLKEKCASTEPNAFVTAEICETPNQCTSEDSTSNLIQVLIESPNGVFATNKYYPDQVETSLNLGSVQIENNTLKCGFMIRSNIDKGKEMLADKVKSVFQSCLGQVKFSDSYSAWEYNPNSPLRDIMAQVYTEMYGNSPKISTIHAGLECGILSEKLPNTDMISIGPTMYAVHTPNEKLDIASVERCWQYLLLVLKNLK